MTDNTVIRIRLYAYKKLWKNRVQRMGKVVGSVYLELLTKIKENDKN
jgi:hypothetical protein